RIPDDFLSRQARVVYFGKIMVFRRHPVNRHEVLVWKFGLQVLRQAYGGDDLEDKIQRSGKYVELVPCGDGVGILASQGLDRLGHTRRLLQQGAVLLAQAIYEQLPIGRTV